MANNKNLHKAKAAKNDEFYTQLVDIENELRHYKDQFKGKTIYCNCDDPYESNFVKYFLLNFNFIGIKRLIATCYGGSKFKQEKTDLWFVQESINAKRPYKIDISFVPEDVLTLEDVEKKVLNKDNVSLLSGDGDFRSEESIELLKQADIVVTNPPFSLFREFVAKLVEMDKKFLIVGTVNAITYKEIFPLIKDDKMWGGYSFNKTMSFRMPDDYDGEKVGGVKYGKVPAITWYTNLHTKKRTEFLDLYKKYTPEEYPKYDNYDAINVDKVSDIPCDYYGCIGVPITFLDKYNPEQFEIVNANDYRLDGKFKATPLIKDEDGKITDRERESGLCKNLYQASCYAPEVMDGMSTERGITLGSSYYDMVARPKIKDVDVYRRLFVRRR